jgi:hypothetical protein
MTRNPIAVKDECKHLHNHVGIVDAEKLALTIDSGTVYFKQKLHTEIRLVCLPKSTRFYPLN